MATINDEYPYAALGAAIKKHGGNPRDGWLEGWGVGYGVDGPNRRDHLIQRLNDVEATLDRLHAVARELLRHALAARDAADPGGDYERELSALIAQARVALGD